MTILGVFSPERGTIVTEVSMGLKEKFELAEEEIRCLVKGHVFLNGKNSKKGEDADVEETEDQVNETRAAND